MIRRLTDLAELLGARIELPDGSPAAEAIELRGVAPIQQAAEGEITFLTSAQYARHLTTTRASAVILGKAVAGCRIPQLVHENAYWAFAKTAQQFYVPLAHEPGVHPKAFVAEDARLGQDVAIYPFAYVDRRARVGERTVIYPGAYLGRDVEVGADCVIHANATLEAGTVVGDRVLIHPGVVLGADGFGFAPGPDGLTKIPQTGCVRVGNDVEIGSNSTVDRGALADTRIGDGTKIDAHVHVGHNVVIGEHTMVCGMTAIAGSARLGNRVLVAGHSAVDNHRVVGDDVRVGGMTGVTKDTSIPGEYVGFPAQKAEDWRKEIARLRRLPRLFERVRELEAELKRLRRERE